jgi:hypothetical protein
MMLDISDTRDAFLEAQADVAEVMAEVLDEFNRPDLLLQLSVMMGQMPDGAWDLVGDETIDKIVEVLHA